MKDVVRPLPASLEAERMVLGSLLLDPPRMADVRDILTAADWSIQPNRLIWNTACELYDRGDGCDRVSVILTLRQRDKLLEAGGIDYITSLDDGMPKFRNLDGWVQIIRDKADRRRFMTACHELEMRAAMEFDSMEELQQAANRMLTELADPQQQRGFVTVGDIIRNKGGVDGLYARREKGISLPWLWLDQKLSGLRPQQLIILGARTAVGKTSAALQIAARAARAGLKVVLFSLEMSRESIVKRIISQQSGIEHDRIRHSNLTPQERHLVQQIAFEFADEESEKPLFIDDTVVCTLLGIKSALQRFTLKRGTPDLVIVDHLHLLREARRESRQQEVADNARQLKLLAMELHCPFLVPAQLNRAGARDNAVPTLADLRESGEIEQHADVVLFIHAETFDQDAPTRPGQFIIAKQREGVAGVTQKMVFLRGTQRFEEADGDEFRN